MDPELANLNLDPPRQPSPLRRGLLPALLVHVAFFAALALSLQWNRDSPSDSLATRGSTQSDTRAMGAAPAPDAQTVAPMPGRNGPTASPTPAPATVEPMQSTPPAPVRAPAERRRDARPHAAGPPGARPPGHAEQGARQAARGCCAAALA